MDIKLPKKEHENVMSSFWTMLRECDSKADEDNDPILKLWVSQWYNQYNRICGTNAKPTWVVREETLKEKQTDHFNV